MNIYSKKFKWNKNSPWIIHKQTNKFPNIFRIQNDVIETIYSWVLNTSIDNLERMISKSWSWIKTLIVHAGVT